MKSWKAKSKQLETEIFALYLACKHPRTPWYAKALAALIIGYAFSPIDLIPDFIPLLGYLDDLILIPAGIAFLVKIIPKDILEECRSKAKSNFYFHSFFRCSLLFRSSTVSMSLKGFRL